MCSRRQLNALPLRFRDELERLFGAHPRKVILFGSYARDEADEGSDVDVLILVDLPREEIAACRARVADIAAEYLFSDEVLISAIIENEDFYLRKLPILPFYHSIDDEGVRIGA